MGNKGIMHAMQHLNQQEDALTQALDRSLRHVKTKQAALAKAKQAHARREEIFRENLKKTKKRAEELNELLGCSKLMQQEDPERHRRLLRPVVLEDMGEVEEDEEVVEKKVIKKKVGGKVTRGQREASQARFMEQLRRGRISKLNAASKLQAKDQTTKMFDKADAVKRARSSKKSITAPDDEVENDSDTTPEAREKPPIVRQPTGSDIEVAREDTPQDQDDFDPSAGGNALHGTADMDGVERFDSPQDQGASARKGLFSFDDVQPGTQSARRPVTDQHARSGARREAQDSAHRGEDAWHVLKDSPEPRTGGRSAKARGGGFNPFSGGDWRSLDDKIRDGFDDTASIASDSSDGLFVSERAPTPSSRGSTPDYMLEPSPEPEAPRYDEAKSDAHVKHSSGTSQKRVASRNHFTPPPLQQPPQLTASVPLPDAQLLEHFTMASRRGNQAPKPSANGKQPSGESLDMADVAVPTIESADEDDIKSEDEEDGYHMDVDVDPPRRTGLFSFDNYVPAARGDDQAASGQPTYSGPTFQERLARAARATDEGEYEGAQDDDLLTEPQDQSRTSSPSTTVNNRSRLARPAFSMTSDDTMPADGGMPTPGYSESIEGSPGAEEELENDEVEVEREEAEDPDFEEKPKPRTKKKATGTKKGGRSKGPRRAPGTRCGECFRLHRRCTHTDPATGLGGDIDEDNEDENDPKYLAMKARKRAAQQAGHYQPAPKKTHYNTYGPDPEPVKATPSKSGLDIGSIIAGKILGDAKKRRESEELSSPDRERTPGKKSKIEVDEEDENENEGDDDEDEE